jgi:hypothetical protein
MRNLAVGGGGLGAAAVPTVRTVDERTVDEQGGEE